MIDNYEVTAVSFSSRVDITNSGVIEFDNKVGVPHDEVTRLVAHISFKYVLRGEELAGTCIADLGTICTVGYTETDYGIKATSFTLGDIDPETLTYADIENDINGAVEAELTEIEIKTFADSENKRVLAEIETNSELTFNNEYNSSIVYESLYPELNDWNTGIGAYPTNILDL